MKNYGAHAFESDVRLGSACSTRPCLVHTSVLDRSLEERELHDVSSHQNQSYQLARSQSSARGRRVAGRSKRAFVDERDRIVDGPCSDPCFAIDARLGGANTRSMRGLVALMSLSLSLVAGCEEPASCVEVSAEPIDFDEATLESMSAAALLQSNEGRYHASLTWLGAAIADEADIHPSSGTTDLEIELSLAGGRLIRIERVGGHRNERLFCPSVIELDVRLRMQSADGALHGIWDAVVSQNDGTSRITIVADPTSTDNGGDFSARPVAPQTWDDDSAQVELTNVFDAGHLEGHIEIRARRQGGGTSLQALAATWTGTRIDD
jgi:hypothetical protein